MARPLRISAFFLTLCLAPLALAGEPASVPSATPRQVQQSVERAIGFMQTESTAWLKSRNCFTCHHLAMPLWAISEAERQGYTIDKAFVAETTEAMIGGPDKLMTSKLFNDPADPPDPRPIGKGVRTGTAFMAVAARSLPSLSEGQKQSLRRIADEILKKQRNDGGWDFFLSRPPINESETTDAAWLIMALQGETGPDATESQRTALAKANAWLADTKLPKTLQDQVFTVLLAARAGKPREEMDATIRELLALQRADGGWSQNADTASDAYATGQTLYVLALAGFTADQPEIKRSIDFLIATQKPDGSWPMTSRSSPDGKTGGSAKLLTPITCAASAWATLGLARLVPKE
ncbi:Squalene-hopene cyclase C-terminal domain-containing protein [Singulisphaera sp. GP187]|uniref:prenyltransferase/squalene oxidase repeat-containing protein n=1 Tax=Singulisphaera sp. GP187 TaxID=1882752 RepID=UPI00092BED8A|nr:prenyltransferase/squalene oxidase repeat-containing protein [Singulisphaera sp. GP187]SIO33550.1 Squalene-hopene cyclase C-terminal domain-containing protein [Singulisphaera sp. GP187]